MHNCWFGSVVAERFWVWIRARIKVFVLRLFRSLRSLDAASCAGVRLSCCLRVVTNIFFEGSSLYIEPTDHPIPTYGLGRQIGGWAPPLPEVRALEPRSPSFSFITLIHYNRHGTTDAEILSAFSPMGVCVWNRPATRRERTNDIHQILYLILSVLTHQ